ncbi:hypothetical protein [Rhizobium leguminosarum]|uniref:hypothetical protein n=1 Tax=Rhizobium leguminosarum TaxID=384 RepID=UPI0003801198|nr:hypothetical protein [Rhizobium leguminosarum]
MEDEEKGSGNHGDFFAVDAHSWRHVCGDGINAAVAYLVMCRGSGGDNLTTRWSVAAVEKYTEISRPRAKAAILNLEQKGRIERTRGGRNPIYKIRLQGASDAEPDWIWLPNSIVDGAGNETPPVERLRARKDPFTLWFFVSLYSLHHLATDGGIEWRPDHGMRVVHYFEKVSEWGQYNVMAYSSALAERPDQFIPTGNFMGHSADQVSPAVSTLLQLGYLEIIPYLVDSDSDDGEIVHPLDGSLEVEEELGKAARAAALAMMPEWRKELPDFDQEGALVPVHRNLVKATVIGIFRLLYRPHTAATARWAKKLEEWQDIAGEFRKTTDGIYGRSVNDYSSMQYQGELKVDQW